jgi:transmembrane sensor
VRKEDNIQINDELITKYLTGEASPEEAIALHDWLETPANFQKFEALERAWEFSHPRQRFAKINQKQAWQTIQGNLRFKQEIPVSGVRHFFMQNKPMLKIAASVLVVLTLSFFGYKSFHATDLVVKSFSTQENIQEIKFSDNSTAVLSRNSTITFPEIFNDDQREISLTQGEAFFKIAPNTNRPFIIHTNLGDIKVVGTAFNVFLSPTKLKVSVEEGKVLLATTVDEKYLEPGYTAITSQDTAQIVVSSTTSSNAWGYATRKFVFKDAPLLEVFAAIEKAYPCFIKIQNKDVEKCKLTATFDDVSTEYMLTLIAETLNLTVTQNEKTFSIEGKGCP